MSYLDPEVLYGKLSAGDGDRVMASTEPVASAISALERAEQSIADGTTTSASGWQGDAADTFAARAEQSGTSASAANERLDRAVKVIEAAAGACRTMRAGADRAIEAWRTRPRGLPADALARLAGQVNQALDTVRTGYEQTLRSYAASLTAIAPAFVETAGGTDSWARTALRPGLTVPPPNSDPKAVADWWKSLSETERDQLSATQFDQLGQLRGLPAEVLDDANRRRIDVDQATFAARGVELDAQLARRAAELGIDPADEGALRGNPALAGLLDQRQQNDRLLRNAEDASATLSDAAELARENGITDGTYVLAYNPDGPGGDGALAVAFGNPDEARNVSVVVPGTGTTVGNAFPTDSAAELRAQMDASSPGTRNATIAWLNYDAPSAAVLEDQDVFGSANAEDGAGNLVSDVDGYRAAAGGDQHVSVIGHSYGSTVVGYAGMNGLAADDIAFVGSPGVGASNVDQLAPGAGHVWAGTTEHDPIVAASGGEWFTEDGSSTGPYDDSFGANVFGTPSDERFFDAHSGYYEEGSESLGNLANIATGDYDAVTDQDWLDDPLPPELPGSDKPIIGPVIDAGANLVKEGVDIVTDAGGGLLDAGGDLLSGDWDGAWDELTGTGGEVAADLADVVVGTAGNVAEGVRDAVEAGGDLVDDGLDGARSAYDNTIGRLF